MVSGMYMPIPDQPLQTTRVTIQRTTLTLVLKHDGPQGQVLPMPMGVREPPTRGAALQTQANIHLFTSAQILPVDIIALIYRNTMTLLHCLSTVRQPIRQDVAALTHPMRSPDFWGHPQQLKSGFKIPEEVTAFSRQTL